MTTSDAPRTLPERAIFRAPGISGLHLTPTEAEVSLLSSDGGKSIELFGAVFFRVSPTSEGI